MHRQDKTEDVVCILSFHIVYISVIAGYILPVVIKLSLNFVVYETLDHIPSSCIASYNIGACGKGHQHIARVMHATQHAMP